MRLIDFVSVNSRHGAGQSHVDRRELGEALLPAQPEQFNNLIEVEKK